MGVKENKSPEASEKTCFVCLRIDGRCFYREMRELGFKPEHAAEIVSWLKLIYELKTPFGSGGAFLSGKSSHVIKASLAYIGGLVFFEPQYYGLMTQRKISDFFNIQSDGTLRGTYRRFLKFLRYVDAVKFQIDEDKWHMIIPAKKP